MARSPTAQQIFDALLVRHDKSIAEAFLDAINDLRAGVDLTSVIQAISRNDLAGAMEALHLDPAAMQPLRQAIQQAYLDGGQFGAGQIQKSAVRAGLRLTFRFDAGAPRAAELARNQTDRLIQYFLQDEAQGITEAISAGLNAGKNPLTVGLDIVGRVNRVTGKRENGLIGLSSQQMQYVRSAQTELASGDPELLRNYLGRALRNKKYDSVVLRAIDEGGGIPASTIQSASRDYANRSLRYRGELIAKQETFAALATARQESYQQLIDKGLAAQQDVTKKWRHFPSEHPRMQHIAMNGKTVGIAESFVLPDGTLMLFPHDPSAPISQTAGCHCMADMSIDWLAGIK